MHASSCTKDLKLENRPLQDDFPSLALIASTTVGMLCSLLLIKSEIDAIVNNGSALSYNIGYVYQVEKDCYVYLI